MIYLNAEPKITSHNQARGGFEMNNYMHKATKTLYIPQNREALHNLAFPTCVTEHHVKLMQ